MSTNSDDYRAISYWPNKDLRIVFAVKRDEETDAMTDQELIDRHEELRRGQRHLRVVDDE